MNKKNPPDYVFLVLAGILVLFGLAMLFSASGPYAYEKFGDSYHFLKHQVLFGLLPGLFLFLILSKINYRFWRRISLPLFIFSIAILIVVFIPGLSATYGKAKSWISIGSFSFQPSELVKLTFLFYLAAWMVKRGDELRDLKRGTLTFLAILAPIALLVMFQPDMGTMFVIVTTAFILFFIAGARLPHLAGILAVGTLLLFLLVKISPYFTRISHLIKRFTTFLHPEQDPYGIGYHINQSLIAIGSGGFFGLGLGHSMQKKQFLPEVAADSIFAVMAEELGFFFTVLFIVLFIAFLLQIFKIANRAQDDYGRLIALGIVSWIGAQMLLNVGSMLGLLPMTGV
ncbi:MAG: FtsW/RodA/SpoVE family cell cycle protein, partial [Patescibacteria group bacterium]|nr:FtsW/RodA/SpoVE family cell cycle protein [Patescibacteria group bacterium]